MKIIFFAFWSASDGFSIYLEDDVTSGVEQEVADTILGDEDAVADV